MKYFGNISRNKANLYKIYIKRPRVYLELVLCKKQGPELRTLLLTLFLDYNSQLSKCHNYKSRIWIVLSEIINNIIFPSGLKIARLMNLYGGC